MSKNRMQLILAGLIVVAMQSIDVDAKELVDIKDVHPTRAAADITSPPHHLLSDTPAEDTSAATIAPELVASVQALLQQIQPTLGFTSGDIVMMPIDLPDATPQPAALMIAQTRSPSVTTGTQVIQTVGVCTLVDISGMNGPVPISIAPGGDVENYQHMVEKLSDWRVRSFGQITVLVNPAHGAISQTFPDGVYTYTPTTGFTGTDKAIFLVNTDGRQFKVVYFIKVYSDNGHSEVECAKSYWRISQSDIDTSSSLAGFVSPSSLLNYQLNQVDVSLNFANLANGAVGETTGHSITLDDNGGGYGWFIDSTPQDNSEFLATSNPNEFIAKAGSEAAGKMDLLTVLLHEYGHALGLDHSADMHDFMAAELQPGVRRTVSDADMA